ncbi:MAG: hypothetical protein E7231_01800 [Cellulosilyticum sp.]|nr:hypothetical protein [Cellulosilyticum sp.]
MRDRLRDLPLTVEEVRRLMKKEEAKRVTWIAVGVSVIAVLVGVIIWIAKKREKELEEHYEYIDEDFEDFDELDGDFDHFDDSIYDDEEDQVEYVKINDFINDEEAVEEEQEEVKTENTEA